MKNKSNADAKRGYYLYYTAHNTIMIRWSPTDGIYKTLDEANDAVREARKELNEYNAKAFNYRGLLA